MAGYRKAREIYMFRRNLNNEITIIPIQGLYISGTHYDPVYEDHNISVTELTSDSNLRIVDYTEVSHNLVDPSGDKLKDIAWNTVMNITNYHTASLSQDDTSTRFKDVTWNTVMNVYSYSSTSNSQTDSATRMKSIEWNTVLNISPKPEPVLPDEYDVMDHYVSIIQLSSNNGLIITEGS